jgi:ABC-type phosphate transport system substrate-binding protein
VAGEVKQNPSIGYVELIYAIQNKLGVSHVRTRPPVRRLNLKASMHAAGVAATIAPDLRARL